MSDTFTCAVCGETFVKGRTDQEAAAEYARLFPDAEPVEQAALICDGCYRYGQSQGWIPGEA